MEAQFARLQQESPDAPERMEMVRVQIFLDRANFRPGKIDGLGGEFTQKAADRYARANNLPAGTLLDVSGISAPYREYTATAEDLKWIGPQASKPPEQEKLKAVPEPPKAFAAVVQQPEPTHLLIRGDVTRKSEPMTPGAPSCIRGLDPDLGLTTSSTDTERRRTLAEWIASPRNPLFARVMVNRIWQDHFGAGLIDSPNDFGFNGGQPSHPELLDWLAVEFRESGWDTKKLIRLMVTSATYRQSARVTEEKLKADPENRLLSRGPRFRIDAEMVRDLALASSGLLVPTIGGPSVKPYQPAGIWETVAMKGSNTRFYKQDHDEKLYRRSMYTFWKRAAPPGSMDIFNAPTRETCTVRRERTNTPLQALVTMNDPQFVEAARALAQNAIKQGGTTFESRLDYVVRKLLARPFRAEELAVSKAALDDLQTFYKSHAQDAKKLLQVGDSKRDETLDASEHAAWTMLVNQLMNLDEVLNK
jgi:hypothetical protein